MLVTVAWVLATWTAVHAVQATAQPKESPEPFRLALSTCSDDLHPSPKVLEIMFLLDASASNSKYFEVFDISYQKILDMLEEPRYARSRVGVGSFIDKPYASSSDYCYRNVHSLTTEISELRDAIHEIPRGEGGDPFRKTALDSLYYSAKRGVTGWSPFSVTPEGQRVIKIAIIFTNGYYETAGRKTAAPDNQPIYPNQQKETYDCVHEDYPSVEQTAEQLLAMDIHPIFLVSSFVHDQFGSTILEDFGQFSVPIKVLPVVQTNPRDILEATRLALNSLICNDGHKESSKSDSPFRTVAALPNDADRKSQLIEKLPSKSKDTIVTGTNKEASETAPASERAPASDRASEPESASPSESVSEPENASEPESAAASESVPGYESSPASEDVLLSETSPLPKKASSADELPTTRAVTDHIVPIPDDGTLFSPTDSSARLEGENVPIPDEGTLFSPADSSARFEGENVPIPDEGTLSSPADNSPRFEGEDVPIPEPKGVTRDDTSPSHEPVVPSESSSLPEAPSVPSTVSEEPSVPVEVARSAPIESEAPYGWCSC